MVSGTALSGRGDPARGLAVFSQASAEGDRDASGGGQTAAVAYTLIETAKLNAVDLQAWLADVISRIAEHPISRIDDLLP